jgi:PAS domain S-box-containing protein
LGRLISYLVESSENIKKRTLELNKINDRLIQEISEKKQAEEALRESERKLHAIFDHHYQLTGLIDNEGRIIAANRTALRFAGVEEPAVIGRYFWDGPWWNPSQRSKVQSAFECAAKGEFVRFETTHPTADGDTRNIDFSLSPVREDGGDVIYVVPEGRDITKIRRSEEERASLQEQLTQAQKMEAIGTLAGGIAHDFNNILSAIVGYTELSKLSVGDKNQLLEYLDNILKAGGRAKDLVRRILTFSRQTEYEAKPVSVQIIVKEAIKLLRASLPSNIEINQNLASEALVMADPVQIHQIIMNLCTNAGHAMKETGGSLTVELSDSEIDNSVPHEPAELKPGKYVKLTVSDTGVGMLPEVLEQIFNPFFTTKEREEGTGLGLSVVHGIVKKIEGEVYARSEPGKGSMFTVLLPALKDTYEATQDDEDVLPKGKGQILFVDDEYEIIDIGQRMLEDLGYKVVTRSSSLEALKLFRMQPHRFDLVITDMTMPQLTGDKLAEELISIREDIPIILCTGFGYQITEEIAKSIGIKELLMKPVLRADLARAIKGVLKEAKNKTVQ